jgi:WXG100 family type VII secretion target
MSKSKSSAIGSVKKLDTKSFTDAISAYGRHIRTFDGIVRGVNTTTGRLIDRWVGKGRNAFKSDCDKVQRNLVDITEIMNEIRDTLNDAHAEYRETDQSVASHMKD